jgi:hypothetical protein
MSNIIKYSLTSSSNSIQSGNFNVGVNNTSTDLTGFFNGISPIISGYTIYINKVSGGPSIYAPKNDTELIQITNSLGGNVATAADALVWINSQSTMTVLNNNYPSIVTSGLVINLDAGFVSSYPKTGTTWKDLSGSGNTGTLINGPTFSSDGGGSISFDGVDDYVTLGTKSIVSNDFSINIWFNSTSNTLKEHFILSLGYSSNPSFLISQDTQSNGECILQAYYVNGGITGRTISSSTLPNTSIINLSFIRENGVNTPYINGVPQTSRIFTENVTLGSLTYVLGWAIPRNKSTAYMQGKIYSSYIYNRALTQQEVIQNYQAGLQKFIPTNGLVLSLDAQNTNLYAVSATTAYDVSGNDYNGTLTNGVQYVANGDGSWSFDGVDDYIDNVGTTSSFSFIQNTGIFTICAWVRLTEFSTTQRAIMGNNRNATTERGFLLARGTAAGRIRFVITNGTDNVFSQQYDNYFLDNNWVFVTIVGNGTNVIYYRNGTLFQNGPNLGTLATGNSTRTLSVGRVTNLTPSFLWSGNISQTSIYNRALTATEISTIYNATRSRYGI